MVSTDANVMEVEVFSWWRLGIEGGGIYHGKGQRR